MMDRLFLSVHTRNVLSTMHLRHWHLHQHAVKISPLRLYKR